LLIRTGERISENQITDRALYLRRREFLRGAGGALALGVVGTLGACGERGVGPGPGSARRPLAGVEPGPPGTRTDETPTDRAYASTYNNFYELGTAKDDPARNAGSLRTEPWTVAVDGEVARPGRIAFEDLLARHTLEERIYRLRCVEAWSMVIPWIGIPLADVIKTFEPTSKARYVAFETLYDPEQLPGQQRAVLDWPYREGLRIDEAVHPLSILAVGMYGEVLPGQNGAPVRLVVPWKYGFKSIKSIVRIQLTESRPTTSWSIASPREYGFYANVNPDVDHPRWSQKRERRIGELTRRPTLPFNGYAEQVASLYEGMDLRAWF